MTGAMADYKTRIIAATEKYSAKALPLNKNGGSMKKYEYKVIGIDYIQKRAAGNASLPDGKKATLESLWNELGLQGWLFSHEILKNFVFVREIENG